MRYVAKKDAQGRVIGFEAVDENGVVQGGATRSTDRTAPETTLPGQPLPEIRGDFRSPAERRAESSAGSSGDGSEGSSYYVPPELLRSATQPPAVEAHRGSGREAAGGTYNPNDANTLGEGYRSNLDEATRDGNFLQRTGARALLGINAINAGIGSAIADTFDFGSAVIDTVRGTEINDDDNFVSNLFRPAGAPTSTAGRFTQETSSFVASMASTGGLVGKIPVVARLARGGFAARMGAEAIKGGAVDFIRAKPAEENLFNMLQGTPLESPVSRFLAADTSEDAGYWMAKTKEVMGGAVLGVTFDLFGESVKVAARSAKEGPMETLLSGLKKAKGLDGEAEAAAMRQLDIDLTSSIDTTQKLLKAAADDEVGARITDARRLLKAADDSSRVRSIDDLSLPAITPLDVDDLPRVGDQTIVAGGTIGPEAATGRLQELEEELLKLSDLRRGLFDMGIDAETKELDEIIIEVTDELDAFIDMRAGNSTVVPGAFEPSPGRADLESRLNGPRITRERALGDARPQVDRELAEVNTRYQEVSARLTEAEEVLNTPVEVTPRQQLQNRIDDLERQSDEIFTQIKEKSSSVSTSKSDRKKSTKARSAPNEELGRLSLSKQELDDEVAQLTEELRELPPDPVRELSVSEDDVTRLRQELSDIDTERQQLLESKADMEMDVEAIGREEDSFIPTPDRAPSAPPNAAGQRDFIRPNDGPGARPDREPSLRGGEGVGTREAVGDPSARNIGRSSTYRTKPQIRRDIARKTVDARIAEANADLPTPTSSGATEAVKRPRAPRQARAMGMSPKDFRSRLKDSRTRGESVGRFINLDKLSGSEDVKDLLSEVINAIEDTKILGKVTDVQLQRQSSNLVNGLKFLDDKDADKILEAYTGVSSNVPVAQLAIREIATDMATQVSDAAKALSTAKGLNELTIADMVGDADLAYKLSRLDYYMTLNKNLGAVQGQGLRARGLSVDPKAVAARQSKSNFDQMYETATEMSGDPEDMKTAIMDMLSTPQGRKTFDKVKADLANAKTLEDVAEVTKASRFAIFNNTSKLIQGVRMNAILSGTRSNMTNVVSNAAMSLYAPLTQAAGAMLDIPYQSLRGNPAGVKASREALQQATSMYAGLVQYFGDSARMARKAFKAGSGIIGDDQVLKEADQIQLLQSLEMDGLNVPKATAHFLSLPSRLLVTGDEFFKQLNYRAFVRSEAMSEAAARGLKGKRLRSFVDDRVYNSFHVDPDTGIPGVGLNPRAKEYSEFVTFQSEINNKTSQNRAFIVGVVEQAKSNKIADPIVSLFVPFIKTPANIMAYTARNSPLGVVSKGWRQDFAAGGAKRARAIGEYALGTTALGGIMGLAMQGKLTGRAPSDPGAREQWFAQGYQPYSVKVGNKWMSFERMEPFAGHFAIVSDMMAATSMSAKADGADIEQTQANLVGAFIAAVRNRTFFEGITDLIDIFDAAGSTDPRHKNTISGTAERIAATLLPYSSLLNEQRRARDQTLREAEGLVEQVINKIPGMSKQLPAQRHWLTGKPITYASNPVFNLYPSSTMQDDPLIKNLLRYNVPLTPPDKKIKGGVELTNEQYSQLLELTGSVEIDGKTQYQALSEVFARFDTTILDKEADYIRQNDEYARSTPLSTEIASVRSKYARYAEEVLARLNPELIEQVRTRLNESGNVKEGMFWLNPPIYGAEGLELVDDPTFLERLDTVNKRTNKGLESLVGEELLTETD